MKAKYRPIFVTGCDRSGTTFLASLLGGADGVVVTPESQFFHQFIGYFMNDELTVSDRERLFNLLINNWRLKIWGIESLSEELMNMSSDKNTFRSIVDNIIYMYDRQNYGGANSVWVDHTPSHVRFLDRIFEVYPDAKIIHIVRDGRAVAASFKKLSWGPNTPLKAAEFWSHKVGIGAIAELVYTNKLIRVKYEDIVMDAENTLPSICDFLEIPYMDSMLAGNGFKTPKYTIHQHQQVGGAPNQERVNSWKHVLTNREIEIFEYLSGDVLSYFGYETLYGQKANSMSRVERQVMEAKEHYMSKINLWKSRYRKWKIACQ